MSHRQVCGRHTITCRGSLCDHSPLRYLSARDMIISRHGLSWSHVVAKAACPPYIAV